MLIDELKAKMAEVRRKILSCDTDLTAIRKKRNETLKNESDLVAAKGEAESVIKSTSHDLLSVLEGARKPGLKLIDTMEAAVREATSSPSIPQYFAGIGGIQQIAQKIVKQETDKEESSKAQKSRLESELARLRQQISSQTASMGGGT